MKAVTQQQAATRWLTRALPTAWALLGMVATGAAFAADHVPPPPQRVPLLITNAVLHTVSGPVITGGRMLVERGRIVALAGPGEALPTPSATPQVLDLGGRHVYPGFISANTSLGLAEVSSVPATVDLQEVGPINPNARALVAINPDSELLPVTRSNGVLAALAVPQGPSGGGFAGTSAVVQMDGWTWEDMAVRREAAVHLALPSMRLSAEQMRGPMEPFAEELRRATAQRLRVIDEAFEAAAAYGRARRRPHAPARCALGSAAARAARRAPALRAGRRAAADAPRAGAGRKTRLQAGDRGRCRCRAHRQRAA
jgi:imidazolonepropionase-like amidohydrolase